MVFASLRECLTVPFRLAIKLAKGSGVVRFVSKERIVWLANAER